MLYCALRDSLKPEIPFKATGMKPSLFTQVLCGIWFCFSTLFKALYSVSPNTEHSSQSSHVGTLSSMKRDQHLELHPSKPPENFIVIHSMFLLLIFLIFLLLPLQITPQPCDLCSLCVFLIPLLAVSSDQGLMVH